jgi:predicted GIY-YIG superfamily endonuclease
VSTADLASGLAGAPPWLVTDLQPDEIHREPDPGPCGCDARRQQVVYTLHFDPPYTPGPDAPRYKQAAHYTGTVLEARLTERLAEHEAGQGARITQVQREAGGSWRVASVEPGGHARERQLKQRGASRRCPICKAEAQAAPEPEPEPGMELEAGL